MLPTYLRSSILVIKIVKLNFKFARNDFISSATNRFRSLDSEKHFTLRKDSYFETAFMNAMKEL